MACTPSESAGEHVRVVHEVDQAEDLLYGHFTRAGEAIFSRHALEQRYARTSETCRGCRHMNSVMSMVPFGAGLRSKNFRGSFFSWSTI